MQQEILKIGKAKFNSNVDEKLLSSLTQQKFLFLKASYWSFSSTELNDIETISKLLATIQQSQCSRMSLSFEGNINIIFKISLISQSLSTIKFSELKSLHLAQQGIQTIQFLSKFQAPLLQKLYIHNNSKVTNLKVLKKFSFPILSILNIENNPTLNFGNYLPLLNKKQFQCIILQSKQDSIQIIFDLSRLMKSQFINLQRIRMASKTRINQQKVINMFTSQRFLKKCDFLTK